MALILPLLVVQVIASSGAAAAVPTAGTVGGVAGGTAAGAVIERSSVFMAAARIAASSTTAPISAADTESAEEPVVATAGAARQDPNPASAERAATTQPKSGGGWFALLLMVLWGSASVALLVGWRGWRPGPLDGPAWRPTVPGGLAAAVVLILSGAFGAALLRVALGSEVESSWLTAAALGAQCIAVAALMATRHLWMTRSECHPSSAWWSLAGGVFGLFVAWPLVQFASMAGATLQSILGAGSAPVVAHETLRKMEQGGFSFETALLVIGAVVIAPVVEEVLYRGVLQQTLRRAGASARGAILITTTLFTIMHLGDGAIDQESAWTALPALFVLGLLFGVLYERSGRLAAPIAAHALFNLVNVLVMLLRAAPAEAGV
ncbi:MAG: CPBP family intramembrane metalloprotease [Phycisphaeraceae bacterium]|nr:CPBP family intramembrane metalloprotease [Phycisphaeraceae bacterium]